MTVESEGSGEPPFPARLAGYCSHCVTTVPSVNWTGRRNPIAIAAYLGRSAVFEQAITQFAGAYADQNERDYQALATAAASGRVTVERDI
ncbi:MAG TPA: DUF2252 family protein [Trebonia sp.]